MDDARARLDRLTLPAGGTVRQALEAIQAGGVEIALVVDADRRLVGVVTDGDVRRALLAGHDLQASVDVCLNTRFHALRQDTGRAEALDLMRARTITQVPIVDADGRLVGLHLMREIVGPTRRPNQAVIMAGGEGRRLRPVTETMPKPMVPVAGRPILERLVLHLMSHGIERFHLAVHYKREVIEDHFGDGARFGCRIDYLRETTPLGSAGAVTLLPEPPTDPLIVLNGDLVTQVDVGGLLAHHTAGAYPVTMCVREHATTVPFGVATLDDRGRVAALREKPTDVVLVNAGIYVLSPDLWAGLERNVPMTMPDVVQRCLDAGIAPGAYRVDEEWADVGRPEDLARARGGQ